MQLPAETAAIFAWLHQAQFVCTDHPDPVQKRWFSILEDHFAAISAHLLPLGFRLERQKHYFYLSQLTPTQNDAREKVLRFLDWLEISLSLDVNFGAGYTIVCEEWEILLNNQSRLVSKLRRLGFRGSSHSVAELLRLWLREMEKAGFIAQTQTNPEQFRVLSSLDYLIRFFQGIHINK